MYKVYTEQQGKNTLITNIANLDTGEVYMPRFLHYSCPEDYEKAEVIPVEPMTAKEYLNDAELEEMLTSTEYIAEEKLDGTRSTLHLRQGGNRVFSRRISKKTDWYAENTDSLPHIRDFNTPPELYGTIIDGEMSIQGKEFKDVSSTLNCLWDEAILRQTNLGFIQFNAFDIIYYKGVYVAKMPLHKRKYYLRKVIQALNFKYIKEVPFTYDNMVCEIPIEMWGAYRKGQIRESKYPNLYNTLRLHVKEMPSSLELDKKTWYEYIVYNNGEGIMLKSIHGTYRHTRGREFTKLKKFDTWDVVILGFVEPTEEYTGKERDKWQYWGIYRSGQLESIEIGDEPDRPTRDHTVEPVTKHFAMNWIGTVKYGVIITEEELVKWRKANPKVKEELVIANGYTYLVVGECSGFDEETRQYFTDNQSDLLYSVMELKAQEVLKTGKLRHPRYLRLRDDKEMERCIWKDHIRG